MQNVKPNKIPAYIKCYSPVCTVQTYTAKCILIYNYIHDLLSRSCTRIVDNESDNVKSSKTEREREGGGDRVKQLDRQTDRQSGTNRQEGQQASNTQNVCVKVRQTTRVSSAHGLCREKKANVPLSPSETKRMTIHTAQVTSGEHKNCNHTPQSKADRAGSTPNSLKFPPLFFIPFPLVPL